MLEVGTLVSPVIVQLPKEALTESVVGKFYHLHIETRGISVDNEVNVAKVLVEQLWTKFHADVVWIRIDNGIIDMQLQGSPFVWMLLLEFLPVILGGLAVAFILSSVWGIVTSVPGWAWALLAVGGILIFVGPSLGKTLSGATKSYQERKEYATYVRSRE